MVVFVKRAQTPLHFRVQNTRLPNSPNAGHGMNDHELSVTITPTAQCSPRAQQRRICARHEATRPYEKVRRVSTHGKTYRGDYASKGRKGQNLRILYEGGTPFVDTKTNPIPFIYIFELRGFQSCDKKITAMGHSLSAPSSCANSRSRRSCF